MPSGKITAPCGRPVGGGQPFGQTLGNPSPFPPQVRGLTLVIGNVPDQEKGEYNPSHHWLVRCTEGQTPPGKAKMGHPRCGCANARPLCQIRLDSRQRLDPRQQLSGDLAGSATPCPTWHSNPESAVPQRGLPANLSQRGRYLSCWRERLLPPSHLPTAELVLVPGLDCSGSVPKFLCL